MAETEKKEEEVVTEKKEEKKEVTEGTEGGADDDDLVECPSCPDGEELLWTSARSKLYCWKKGMSGTLEWKERGVGCVYFFRYKDNGKVHAVMRREKTYKVCMNHMVVEGIEMKPNTGSEKSWVWSVSDYADEEDTIETFAIRFKTKEDTAAFKEAYEKYGKPVEAEDTSAATAENETKGDAEKKVEEDVDRLGEKLAGAAVSETDAAKADDAKADDAKADDAKDDPPKSE